MKSNQIYLILLSTLLIGCNYKEKQINTWKRRTAEYETQRTKTLDSIFTAEKFNSKIEYEPLCLCHNGKPIFSIGQKIFEIDSTLSYRMDPNMDYQGYEYIVTDYLTTDDHLSIKLGEYSSINGITFFSADKKYYHLFNVSGSWYFDLNEDNMEKVAIDSITNRLFPILKGKIKLESSWKYDHQSKNQIEHWTISTVDGMGGWNLHYEVELK
jgi:hypothetical protein